MVDQGSQYDMVDDMYRIQSRDAAVHYSCTLNRVWLPHSSLPRGLLGGEREAENPDGVGIFKGWVHVLIITRTCDMPNLDRFR